MRNDKTIGAVCQPMAVREVDDYNSTRVEPELDSSWSEMDKLRWWAGLIFCHTGITIRLIQFHDNFVIVAGWHNMTIHSFIETWNVMAGIEIGWEIAKDKL